MLIVPSEACRSCLQLPPSKAKHIRISENSQGCSTSNLGQTLGSTADREDLPRQVLSFSSLQKGLVLSCGDLIRCLPVWASPGHLFGLPSTRSLINSWLLSLLCCSWGSLPQAWLLFCLLFSPHHLDASIMGSSTSPSGRLRSPSYFPWPRRHLQLDAF